ncbi:MAG: HAD-IB family hydrolase [Deltaproteobacteria bacterium]|nr:HAD-IB family hydrolase [Deltaproteobacteria bacterium]
MAHGAEGVAAFLDLDRTLLSVNSGRLWVMRERRVGRLGMLKTAKAGVFLVLYHFGLVDMERVLEEALATVKGLPEDTVREWTRQWFRDEVVSHEAPGARAWIDAHRAAGHLLVLLTSSSPYATECAVEHFGLDAGLSMRYGVEGGRFTGQCERPLCYAEGKVTLAERLADERGIDLARSYFYTDSATDLPMLLRVGHPRIVNPDPRLRIEARSRGWPVIDWTRPPALATP